MFSELVQLRLVLGPRGSGKGGLGRKGFLLLADCTWGPALWAWPLQSRCVCLHIRASKVEVRLKDKNPVGHVVRFFAGMTQDVLDQQCLPSEDLLHHHQCFHATGRTKP